MCDIFTCRQYFKDDEITDLAGKNLRSRGLADGFCKTAARHARLGARPDLIPYSSSSYSEMMAIYSRPRLLDPSVSRGNFGRLESHDLSIRTDI